MTKNENKKGKEKKQADSAIGFAPVAECRQKKTWKNFLSFASGEGRKATAHDWMTLFSIAILLFLGVLVVNGLTFYSVFLVDERVQAMSETSGSTLVNRILLEEVLSSYKEKEETFHALQMSAPNVIDPSS